jgi:hypothetical protein
MDTSDDNERNRADQGAGQESCPLKQQIGVGKMQLVKTDEWAEATSLSMRWCCRKGVHVVTAQIPGTGPSWLQSAGR